LIGWHVATKTGFNLSLMMNNLGVSEFLWLPNASNTATDVWQALFGCLKCDPLSCSATIH